MSGRIVPLQFVISPRAKRLKLKVRSSGLVEVLLPKRVPLKAGWAFVRAELQWLEQTFEKVEEAVLFEDGAVIPLKGVDHTVRHCPEARRSIWIEDGFINVSGAATHLPRRITDWLKKSARTELLRKVDVYCVKSDVSYNRIMVRDQKSRWGSCSSEGNLNFSWRLYLMPEPILNYVVAHEVAHLTHMNHSRDFWALVEKICPDMKSSRRWMKKNAGKFHKYNATF